MNKEHTINILENLPIEKAQQVVEWFDSSPLTDETLEGLGFDTKGKLYVNSAILSANYNTNRDIISVSMQTSTGYIKYKTVGKVKMLIEALKGDE